jgi:aconitase (EC 4.2.1.3)
MGQTLTEKILADHLVEGELEPGSEIGISVDQVLTQDTTGTMVWLQFEALELDEVQTELVAQYCDHQTYQFDFKNTDDHRFLRSAAGVYGAYFSRPGNGICHNVHKENFAAPGKTLLGSDSHTPTPGGWASSRSGRAGWTSRWRWVGVRTTWRCQRSSTSGWRVSCRGGRRRRM